MSQFESEELTFEYFLEEFLTEQPPPDLTERILRAWQAEASKFGDELRPEGKLPREVQITAVPIQSPTFGQEAKFAQVEIPNSLSVSHELPSSKSGMRTRREYFRRQLTIAASVAVVLCGLILGVNNYLGSGPNAPSTAPSLNGELANELTAASPTAANDTAEDLVLPAVDPSSVHGVRVEKLSLADVPFLKENGPATSLSDAQSSNSASVIARPKNSVRLPQAEVVSLIDAQFFALWQSLGVEPTESLSEIERGKNIGLVLTGRTLSDEQVQTFFATGKSLEDFASSAVRSQLFATIWGEQIAGLWVPSRQPHDLVRGVLVQQILSRSPWNDVVLDLLGGPIGGDRPSAASEFIGLHVGSENHTFARHVGSHFLNTALGCVRCHDYPENMVSPADSWARSQGSYWSVLLLLKGLSASSQGGGSRLAIDAQPKIFANDRIPQIYFPLPDERMKVAEARLPNGQTWDSKLGELPRQALAKYISRSAEMDEATVNLAWRMVFGRPLVPIVAEQSESGLDERRDLMRALAVQYRMHGRDLGTLVQWLVLSAPFARTGVDDLSQRTLLATKDELRKLQIRQSTFAIGDHTVLPIVGPRFDSLLKNAIAINAIDDPANRSSLGQLNPEVSKSGNKKSISFSSEITLPTSCLLDATVPEPSHLAYVDRLLASQKLSWEQRVAHVIELGDMSANSPRVQQMANELLVHKGGDPKATLLELMWVVENSVP
ncbi:MAG: hypothetical protein KDB03_16125 [Planctomycetales bacterium]|nr:hypothetical protein [Planctomycetales bacterium]